MKRVVAHLLITLFAFSAYATRPARAQSETPPAGPVGEVRGTIINRWYQTGPYWAYYYTGRYQDVIKLATTTLDTMSEPVLEESYYWHALAREASGDSKGALKDLQSALKFHPGFEPALTQLRQLGVTP